MAILRLTLAEICRKEKADTEKEGEENTTTSKKKPNNYRRLVYTLPCQLLVRYSNQRSKAATMVKKLNTLFNVSSYDGTNGYFLGSRAVN